MRSGGHRPAGGAGGSQPAGATGALPGQQPPTAAVRPRFPSLPPSPAGSHTTSSSFNREGARAPRPAFPAHRLSSIGRLGQELFPRSPWGQGRLGPSRPEPPMQELGRFQPSDAHSAPVPAAGGCAGAGRKRRRHDVMQTAMGFVAAAAFFWGGTGEDGGGAVAAALCPPPAAPPLPAQCSWCRSRAGSSPANPRPAPQRALPGAGAVAPGRRARPFPQGREREAGREGAGPGRPHGRPRERGRKRRKRKGSSSAAIPRKAAGARERKSPQPPTRSPRGEPGGNGPREAPPTPAPPWGQPSSTNPTDPSSAASALRTSLHPSPGSPCRARPVKRANDRTNERAPYHGAAAAGPAAAARTARPRAAAAAASSRRGSQSAGAVSLRRPLYTWGCIPPPEWGSFPSSRRAICEVTAAGSPAPSAARPLPCPAGPHPQPAAERPQRGEGSPVPAVALLCRALEPAQPAGSCLAAGSPPLSGLEPPERGHLGQAGAFFIF